MKYVKIILILLVITFIYSEDLYQDMYARFMLLEKQPEKTLVEMKKIVSLMESENYSKVKLSEGYYWLSACYAYNNLPDLYLDSINKSIELNPEYIEAYIHRGKANILRKKYDEAKADFSKVLSIDPNHKEAKEKLKQIESKKGN